jgi:hypothetical protein
MENIILQFSNLDFSPVFSTFYLSVTQPFLHSFHSVVPAFMPLIKTIHSHPGLTGGVIFILLTYTLVTLVHNPEKEKVVITGKKPSGIYREGFPSGNNS